MEIINGELLGDGSVYLSGSYKTNACFSHSTANISYGKYLYDKLKNEIPLLNPEIINGRNGGREQFRTRTTTNFSWTEIYRKWYINNKKIIPNDLKLTKETCLHWYLGDGYFEGGVCKISTCGFSFNEVKRLSNMLNLIGFECNEKKTKWWVLHNKIQ